MNDLIEFVEDLETLETWADTPGFHQALEQILPKWRDRLAEAEAFMSQQAELFDNVPI